MLEIKYYTHLVRIIQGDITDANTDAIVNAANSSLILGAGVAGAIRQKGGPSIQEECLKIGHISTGMATITTGGKLNAHYVIHAVGPIWGEQSDLQSQKILSSAIIESLNILVKSNLNSITFPALSTGIYGFPKRLAASIFKNTIEDFLKGCQKLLLVQICLYSMDDYAIFEQEFKKIE